MAERNELREEILTVAGAVSACAEGERVLLGKLCAAAEEEIERRLRDGVTASDCAGVYVCAAAWLAAAALELTRGGEGFSSLRAGDMTVTARSAKERAGRAEQLRAQAWRMLAPYTTPGGFAFCGVSG